MSQPIRLLLLRHGNTFEADQIPYQVGARSDLILTATGRAQAESFAQYVGSQGILPRAIYAGTLKRQTESALILGKRLQVEDRIHLNESALTELDYGPWEGLTAEKIARHWPKEYSDWTEQSIWPKGIFKGTFGETLRVIEDWVQQIRKLYVPGDIVLGVTSNGILRFFASLQKEEWSRLQRGREMDKIKVKTGHFCDLLLYESQLKIKRWNVNPL